MSDLQWRPPRGSTPQPMGCNGDQLILALTTASQPWEKLDIIDATLNRCGLDPFIEVLDIPNRGVLGVDIHESARRERGNSLICALVIQAFGKIPNLVEKSKIAALSQDVSKNLLTVLQQKARYGETTLIKWSATIAIRSIWYDEEWQKQGIPYSANVGIDAPRHEQRIIEDQVKSLSRIQRYNYTGSIFSTEYQDYLDFWAYGPTWELFKLSSYSEQYEFLVQQVLRLLLGRGVKYGLKAENNYIVIEKSLELAERIFDHFNFRQILSEISKFLQHSETRVRDIAVKILTPYKRELDQNSFYILEALSFRFIEPKTTKLESLTISEIKSEIVKCKEYKEKVENIFLNALSACYGNTTNIKNQFSSELSYLPGKILLPLNDYDSINTTMNLSSSQFNDIPDLSDSFIDNDSRDVRSLFSFQLNTYRKGLNEQIDSLENQVKSINNYQTLIRENSKFISEVLSRIEKANCDIYDNLLKSSNFKLIEASQPSTYNECLQLDKALIEYKDLILCNVRNVTNDLDKQVSKLRDSVYQSEQTIKTCLKIAGGAFLFFILAEIFVVLVIMIIVISLIIVSFSS